MKKNHWLHFVLSILFVGSLGYFLGLSSQSVLTREKQVAPTVLMGVKGVQLRDSFFVDLEKLHTKVLQRPLDESLLDTLLNQLDSTKTQQEGAERKNSQRLFTNGAGEWNAEEHVALLALKKMRQDSLGNHKEIWAEYLAAWGKYFFQASLYLDARVALEHSVEFAPKNYEARLLLSQCLKKLGFYQKSLLHLEWMKKEFPEALPPRRELAFLYRELKMNKLSLHEIKFLQSKQSPLDDSLQGLQKELSAQVSGSEILFLDP